MGLYDRLLWSGWLDEITHGGAVGSGAVPGEPPRPPASVVEMFAAASRDAPDFAVIKYFDAVLTAAELGAAADAFAAALLAGGLRAGDRLALYLPDTPQFVIACLGVWKAGGCVLALSPTHRAADLARFLADSDAAGVVYGDGGAPAVAAALLDAPVRLVIRCADRAFQRRDDPRLFRPGPARPVPPGELDLEALLERHRGEVPPPASIGPDDAALLTVANDGNGPARLVTNSHAEIVRDAQVFRDLVGVRPGDAILGVAPLCTLTGFVGHVAVALLVPVSLILTFRFDPLVSARAAREHRATLVLGGASAFLAWANSSAVQPDNFRDVRIALSGGSPTLAGAMAVFEKKFDVLVDSARGLVSTAARAHDVPDVPAALGGA
jgi:long-chain acyl-CoA synthetase